MKILAYSTLPAALLVALAGCDSAADEQREVQEEAFEATGDVVDEQAEALEAQAEELDDAGMDAQADAVDAEAEQLEDTADQM